MFLFIFHLPLYYFIIVNVKNSFIFAKINYHNKSS